MTTINGRACVVNGMPVDKVFSDGKQVYGKNLLTGTSNQETSGTISTGTTHPASPHARISVTTGEKFVYQVLVTSGNTVDLAADIDFYSGGMWKSYIAGNTIKAGNYGCSIVSFKIPDGIDNISINTVFMQNNATAPKIVYWQEEKLDLGTTATPWTPAPEDVLKNYIAAPKNLTATVIDLSTEKLDWE